MSETVRVAAHAKLNLLLRILARDDSGFHGIETVFTLLTLADELSVTRVASGVSLTVEGADTGPADDNLAVRAARAVLDATGRRFGVKIHLTKRIPMRAGLGGGSSDAAAALLATNLLAEAAIPRHELLQFAARLGSDIPFFLSGAPLALGWNRGERLFRLAPPPAAAVLLAVPETGVSTPEAYRRWDESQGTPSPRGSVILDAEALESWGGIARLGGNDFESVVWGRDPSIREAFEGLAQTRPLLVRMSGSGSAVAALYRSDADRENAALTMGNRFPLIPTSTRATVAPPPVAETPAGT